MKRTRAPLVVVLVLAALAPLALVLAAGFRPDTTYRYLNVFQEVWSLTRANYVEPVDEAKLLRGAWEGMARSLDAVSAWLPPGEEKVLAEPLGPAGPGLELLPAGGVAVVVRVEPGGPAEKEGIHEGDQVWRVDGRPARRLSWPQLRHLLHGNPGETREIVLLDASTYKLRHVELVLAPPADPGWRLTVRGEGKLLHLRLGDLGRIDPVALRTGLAKAVTEHPGAELLVDLRGVVGADPAEVARLAGVLVPGGDLLVLVDAHGGKTPIKAPAAEGDLPVAGKTWVLVDGSTAGSGEALAALLRRTGATLLGRKTFGLAGVPEVIPLRGEGSLLLATREMRLADGTGWAEDGLEPAHVVVVPPAATWKEGQDRFLEEAIRWILEEGRKPAASEARPAA